MRKHFTLIGVALIVALTVSPAFAAAQTGQSAKTAQATPYQSMQEQTGQLPPGQAQMGQQPLSNAFLADELMNKKVISMRQNEPLGTVQNLVIDPNGFIAYILLEPAKGMKETGQLVAIPWDVAHPTIHNNQVEVFLSKQQIQKAPTISKNNLAQLQNPQWERQNFAYFGMGYTPQEGYEMPQQGYGMPPQGYGMPPQGYGAGTEGYNY